MVAWANRLGGFAGGLRVEALNAAGDVLAAVNFSAKREGLNIPALSSVWAARALVSVTESGYRSLLSLATFDDATASLRRHGFEVTMELGAR